MGTGAPEGEVQSLSETHRRIFDGALRVFARDGYARAGIDAIAAEAGVSTRTIYNHCKSKAGLFGFVIEESARRVAAAHIAIIDRHLSQVTNVEEDLNKLGIEWRTPMPNAAAHFALVRHLTADEKHVPAQAVEAWQNAGPRRVRRALAAKLSELGSQGLLRVSDPETAALHFALLISGMDPTGRSATSRATIEDTVAAGVRTFLYGHL